MVERELSDNKHAEYLWSLYNQKPTSQKKQIAYENHGIEVNQSPSSFKQMLGSVSDEEEMKGRPSDLNYESFKLIADFRNKRFEIESTLMGENRMEENISRELSNLKRNHEEQTLALKKARDDFDSSLDVVSEDLSVKIETLKKVLSTEQTGVRGRTDANLQVFTGKFFVY